MFRLGLHGNVVAWALGMLALTCAERVWAQATVPVTPQAAAAGAPEDPRVQARNHFVLGTQLFAAHSFRDALREFELAATLAPSAELWFNMGRAHEELGEYEPAARAFDRYLHDRVDAQDAAQVRARVAELDSLANQTRERNRSGPNVGGLRLHVQPPQALVLVDGQTLSAAAIAQPLLLAPGRHRLDVSHEQYLPLHARFDVQSGLLTAAYADLQPATRTRMRAVPRGFSWALFGLSAAGAVTSAALGGVAMLQQSDGNARAAQLWGERTDVALVGTAVCALAAAIVYYVEGRSAPTERVRLATLR
jgi:tetratricopeptide (TPR) repeat protein